MRKILTLILAAGLLVTACTAAPTVAPDNNATGGDGPAGGGRRVGSLEPFADCDALVSYATEHADEAWGTSSAGAMEEFSVARQADPLPTTAAADSPESADAASAPASDQDHSTTNVQETGVDEADIVKTDGERVITTVGAVLRVLDATTDEPTVLGELPLDGYGPHELFLAGDRAIVVSNVEASTSITEVDLSDPAAPEVVATRLVDGSYLTARASDGTARIVVGSAPPILEGRVNVWNDDGTLESERIEQAGADAWLPTVTTVSPGANDVVEPLLDCNQVSHPVSFAGLGTVTVLSTDLSEPLGDLDPVSVMADGQYIYASPSNLYVATTAWATAPTPVEPGPTSDVVIGLPATATTEIHQFSIDQPGAAHHVASGSVEGTMLNQFAMSEYDGRLRVATTTEDWEAGTSESTVSVFDRAGDSLDVVGRVDGLGRGEQIFAVRFQGPTAYVVTFEQTDPLYTVDLSDPSDPQVVGELKLLGYSAYLHPLGDDLLLGVGQDATEEGRTLGTQVSLFDVSNPAAPERLQHLTVSQATSDVEYDHRAFLWWADDDLAVVPIEDYSGVPFSGAIGIDIGRDGIGERGRISHEGALAVDDQQQQDPSCPPGADCIAPPFPGASAHIVRSLVIGGDEVWTVSDAGVKTSDLATLSDVGWVSFT